MTRDRDEIVRKADALIATHPNVSLRILAERLGTTEQMIEASLREIEGLSFGEYRQSKRLEQAFKQLGTYSLAANGPYEMVRSRRRLHIPRTKVQYRLRRLWGRKSGFSGGCPLVDFSRDGLAFLADEALKPQKQITLLLQFPKEEAVIKIEGRVVYSVATGIAGYRYRIGVQYLPFGKGRGCNPLKTLDVLSQLEKEYTPEDV